MGKVRRKEIKKSVADYHLKDIAKELSRQTLVSYNDCYYLLETTFGILKGMILTGNKVVITGFGQFYHKISPAAESKYGYLPSVYNKTGEKYGTVPARPSYLVPAFKYSNVLLREMRENTEGYEGEEFDEEGKFIRQLE